MFEMPPLEDTNTTYLWNDPSNYSLSPQEDQGYFQEHSQEYSLNAPVDNSNVNLPSAEEYSVQYPWFSNSFQTEEDRAKEEDIMGGVWDWVKSEQGVSVLGGALDNISKLYIAEKMAKARGGSDGDYYRRRADRIDQHNRSINTPMDMGLRRFKK